MLLYPWVWLLIVCITSSPFVSFLRWLKTVLESAGWWSHPSLLSVTHQATPQPCLQPITCPLIWVTTHTSFRTHTRPIIRLSPFLEIYHRSSSPSTTSPRQYIVSKVSPLPLASVETGYTAVTCVASSLRLLWNKQGRKSPNWNRTPLADPSFLCLGFCLIQVLWLGWVTALSCFCPTKSKE